MDIFPRLSSLDELLLRNHFKPLRKLSFVVALGKFPFADTSSEKISFGETTFGEKSFGELSQNKDLSRRND